MLKKFTSLGLSLWLCALGALCAQTVSLTPPGMPAPTLDASRTSPFSTLWGSDVREIKGVTIAPDPPRAGQPVTVTAEIPNGSPDSDMTRLISARLSYSVNGGQTWTALLMRRKSPRMSLWQAIIPPQKSGTRVQFFLQTRDSFNGITTELPLTNTQFPPALARMQLVAEDADDPDDLVPPELDLLKTHVGYDEEYLYISQSVQGDLKKGRLTKPPAPCLYFIALMNMDDASINYFSEGPMLVYSPMGRLLNVPTHGLTRVEKLLRDPKTAFSADAGVEFTIDTALGAPTMHFKVKRHALGDNPSRAVKLVSFTSALTNLQRPQLIPWEAAPYGLFYMRSHAYEVR